MKHLLKVFVIILVLICSSACGIVVNNDKFDSAKWKSGDARARGKMAYDLQNNKLLIGKNEQEVLELLGKDDYPSDNRKTYEIDTNVITDVYFSVHFDEATQKVTSTDIGD